jgi:hypothetical protein
MKFSDLVGTRKAKRMGRFPARWVANFFGHNVSGRVKEEAVEQVVNDVKFAVEHRFDNFCWFDDSGDVHVVRATVGGWEHIISGSNRKGPCMSSYPTNMTFDEMKAMVRKNWDIR